MEKPSENLKEAENSDSNYSEVFHHSAQVPSINRMWNVSTTLEKRLYPMPFIFPLITIFSPVNYQLRMGVGYFVG